jgi:hypothetical protein
VHACSTCAFLRIEPAGLAGAGRLRGTGALTVVAIGWPPRPERQSIERTNSLHMLAFRRRPPRDDATPLPLSRATRALAENTSARKIQRLGWHQQLE